MCAQDASQTSDQKTPKKKSTEKTKPTTTPSEKPTERLTVDCFQSYRDSVNLRAGDGAIRVRIEVTDSERNIRGECLFECRLPGVFRDTQITGLPDKVEGLLTNMVMGPLKMELQEVVDDQLETGQDSTHVGQSSDGTSSLLLRNQAIDVSSLSTELTDLDAIVDKKPLPTLPHEDDGHDNQGLPPTYKI